MKPGTVGQGHYPLDGDTLCQSPFLRAFLKTDRAWDDVAKTEWADDVERRLYEVRARIDPRPILLGYAIHRVKNCVTLSTVTPNELCKQTIAELSGGQWPRWSEIATAVPEIIRSTISFDACNRREWCRKWDVEDEMSRIRLEHGIAE